MPFYPAKKKYEAKKKKTQQYGPIIKGRPKLTRSLRVKQNLTRDYKMFKYVTRIAANGFGNIFNVYHPGEVHFVKDFQNWGRCWEEYKCTWFSVKLTPIGVGSESLQSPASGEAMFKRGVTLTWLDQGEPNPTFGTIDAIIVRPSCQVVRPRVPHIRKCYRAPGNPEWGKFDADGSGNIANGAADSWTDTRVRLWGQDYTPVVQPGSQTYFWATITYAILFRGRSQFTAPTVPVFQSNLANPTGEAEVLT